MAGASLKHLGMLLVFAVGFAAAVYGVAMLVLLRDLDSASVQAAGGLALVGWVIFHPARAPEGARP